MSKKLIGDGETGRTSETFLTTYTYSLSVKSNWNSFKKHYFSLPTVTLNWSKIIIIIIIKKTITHTKKNKGKQNKLKQ